MVAPEPLRIRLLGGLDVEGMPAARLGSRKARTLVKLLALGRNAVVPTGAVCEALWPDDDTPARPAEQVGVLVSRLRKVLGQGRIERTEGGWLLAVDWLDVAELEARAAEALERLDAGQHASARTAARAALDLVRGPLLPDDEGAWVERDRARCERLAGRVRLVAAEAALRAGDTSTAASEAERALDVDPFDESALRTAMRAHVAGGRPASALALYARVRGDLADELGVSPTAETEALHRSVLLADAAPAPALLVASPSLVGRAAELDQLQVAAARVGRGDGSWSVEVVGDAGIGKTALLDAWMAASPMTVLRSRCDEHGHDLPLQPVLDALGIDGREPVTADRQGATSVVDPVVGQTLLFADLIRQVDAGAGPAGVALVLDDVQWADPMTVAFCRLLRRRATRCLVVVAGRTGLTVDIAADQRIVVPALGLDAVTELVGPERAPALLDRSGGNPLFLRHLEAGTGDGVPASVREAVMLRVESLGSDVAAVIRAAAVFGLEIDLDLLAAVLRTPAVELLGHLDVGAAAGLIDDRGVLAFSHALVRDALVAGTAPSRLAWLHREAAGVLAARTPVDEPAVARHARAGGDRVLASASLVRAGEATAARFDLAGAETLLDDAISLHDTPAARLARARVRLARYRLDDAARDADEAATLGAGAEAFEVAGWIAYYQRDHDRAVRYAEEGAARADDDGGVRASCLALRGRVRHSAGDLAGAEHVLTEALRIAPGGVRGLAQVWLSGVRSHQSRPADAVELADRALLRPNDIGHPFAPLHGRFARVTALGYAGRMGEALAAVDEALALIAEEGEQAARFASIFLNARGWLLRNLGLLAEADAANVEALAGISAVAPMGEPFHVAHLDLLDGAIARGDDAGIARWLDEAAAIDSWDGSMSWRQRARLDLLRARLALRDGEADRACTLASSVRERAVAWPVPRYRLLAELVIDEAAARAGTADRDLVADRLRALEDVAAPEAWWRTAELAVALEDERLAADADRRAEAIAASASTARPDAATAITDHLRSIRTRPRPVQ